MNHPNLGGVAGRGCLNDGCAGVRRITSRINRQAAGRVSDAEAVVQRRDNPSLGGITISLGLDQRRPGCVAGERIGEEEATGLIHDAVGSIRINTKGPQLTCACGACVQSCQLHRRSARTIPKQAARLVLDHVRAVCQRAELPVLLQAVEACGNLWIKRRAVRLANGVNESVRRNSAPSGVRDGRANKPTRSAVRAVAGKIAFHGAGIGGRRRKVIDFIALQTAF